MKRAIYLSGGGARGAYQAGVLKCVSDILRVKKLPVDILSSVSAGSINASFLAMYADNFPKAVDQLLQLWRQLSFDQIFKANTLSLMQSLGRNVYSMMFHHRGNGGNYLLDTSPLKQFLRRHLDFKRLNRNIDQGLLSAFEVSSTCYDIGKTISFIHTYQMHPGWDIPKHKTTSTSIAVPHILASSALPLFFPAVKIDHLHFGDGGLRLSAPLRPSIRLGADRILIIGTRRTPPGAYSLTPEISNISFAKVFGNIFNALFLDSLDRDLELLLRMNDTLALLSAEQQAIAKWRKIDVLLLRPRDDLGELAAEYEYSMPFLLRYLADALGGKEQAGDFLSFLLFEADYAKKLIELGYQDAKEQEEAIAAFFENSL